MTRIRTNPGPVHPDHHLWRNGRVWWVAFTFHTQARKHRVRRSLGTEERETARLRRDELLERYGSRPGWRLALRYVAREPRGGRTLEGAHLPSIRIRPIVA